MAGDAHEVLAGWVELFRTLPQTVVEAAAPVIAQKFEEQLRRNIAAGKTPDGQPWEPTEEGKPALRGAGKALRASADGTVIVAELNGPEALHHAGRAKGGVKRQILPDREIPDPLNAAIKETLGDKFREVLP